MRLLTWNLLYESGIMNDWTMWTLSAVAEFIASEECLDSKATDVDLTLNLMSVFNKPTISIQCFINYKPNFSQILS